MAFKIDVGAALSDKTFVGDMKQGVISRLVGSLPDVKIRGEEFFDLSARTKGEVVGEAEQKSPTPTAAPLRRIRTTKIQYTERFSDEFLEMDRQEQLGIVNELARKWLLSDFLLDLDTVIFHGINPLTGAESTVVEDYIAKPGSSIYVPSTGTDAGEIDTDVTTMMTELSERGVNVNGVALSTGAAGKLASIRDGGSQKYPELGMFGFNPNSFAQLAAASSAEVGEFNGMQAVAGNWNALKWGVAKEMPVKTIEYGDPDGLGDLQRNNQVALRFECIFGFGLANPNALAWVGTQDCSEG